MGWRSGGRGREGGGGCLFSHAGPVPMRVRNMKGGVEKGDGEGTRAKGEQRAKKTTMERACARELYRVDSQAIELKRSKQFEFLSRGSQ